MEDMIYMEDLLKFYLKKIEIVIFTTLLFFEIGIFFGKEKEKVTYRESTSIILVNHTMEQEDYLSGATLGTLENYMVLLNSKKITNNVINTLKLKETTESLQEKAMFTISPNSQMVTITVTDESNELAVEIANTYVKELKKEVLSIYKFDNIMILDKAIATGNAITEKDNTAVILAVIGFVTASAIIILIYCFNDNVRIMMRKEKILGAELLKTAIYKKKDKPFESLNKNKEKFTKIKSIICKLKKENNIKTIMITSDTSKSHSNYSANIANIFTTITEKVLLIDCNKYGTLSTYNEEGILDLIESPANVLSRRINKYIRKEENISFLPIGNLEKYSTDLFSSPKFINVLDKLKSQFDIIFIEVPDITKHFEGMILTDIMDATIITMDKNKITKNKIKNFYDNINNGKNNLLAIAPLKRKIIKKINLKKINLPKITFKKKNK